VAEIKADIVLDGFAFSGGHEMHQVLTLTMRDVTGERFDVNFFLNEELTAFLNLLSARVVRTKRVPTINAKVRLTLEVEDE
jgi:hypothetical protein